MLYYFYELNHAAVAPARAVANLVRTTFSNPLNPMSRTLAGKSMAAAAGLFERTTRRYSKPEFGITQVEAGGRTVAVREKVVWQKPFCRVLHFERQLPPNAKPAPRLLIVAPMSGHYATLLRGTVTTMLADHDVYITDWTDARMVPLLDGPFGFDDYVDYVMEILRALGGGAHVMAVCQPSVPVLAAVSMMQASGDKASPETMILMGGPVDTRINPTAVNSLAEQRGTDWFARNVIVKVPFPHPGFMRDVYPGFLQLSGFMSMNLDRHMTAHKDLFRHLVEGDGDNVERHEEFYDEYLAVMDLTAEFYLETVEKVFVKHALPKGELTYRGTRIDPGAIRDVALLTIEGEHDDISGIGQTQAAHTLCKNIPEQRKSHHLQPGVGHYGVFNGRRFRSEIAPRITDFIRDSAAKPVKPAKTAKSAKSANLARPLKPVKSSRIRRRAG